MEVVLVMFKDDERREFPLTAKKTVIGRRQDCNLRIPTQDVSRKHCELVTTGDEFAVRDLGSSNGTFVNGERISQAQLKPGDRLSVGPVTFVVSIDGKPAQITPEDAAPPLAEADVAVTPIQVDGESTDDILDLGDIDFDLAEDQTSAIEAMLEIDDDDDEV